MPQRFGTFHRYRLHVAIEDKVLKLGITEFAAVRCFVFFQVTFPAAFKSNTETYSYEPGL